MRLRAYWHRRAAKARQTPPPPPARPALRLVGQPIPIVAGDGVHCGICGQARPLVTPTICATCWAAAQDPAVSLRAVRTPQLAVPA